MICWSFVVCQKVSLIIIGLILVIPRVGSRVLVFIGGLIVMPFILGPGGGGGAPGPGGGGGPPMNGGGGGGAGPPFIGGGGGGAGPPIIGGGGGGGGSTAGAFETGRLLA